MNSASKSVYYFGFYLLLTGLTLIAAPNMLLSLLQIPETTEVWIRILGTVVTGVGLLYVKMAPANHTLFLSLTIYLRLAILVWFTSFVLFGWAPWQLLIFGIGDGAGALWTYFELKKS